MFAYNTKGNEHTRAPLYNLNNGCADLFYTILS